MHRGFNPHSARPPADQEQHNYLQQLQQFTLSDGQSSSLPLRQQFPQQHRHQHHRQHEHPHRLQHQQFPQHHHYLDPRGQQQQQQQRQWLQQQQQRQYHLQQQQQQQQQHPQQQYQLQNRVPPRFGLRHPRGLLPPPANAAVNPFQRPLLHQPSARFPNNEPFLLPTPPHLFQSPSSRSAHSAVPFYVTNPLANVGTDHHAHTVRQGDFAKRQAQTDASQGGPAREHFIRSPYEDTQSRDQHPHGHTDSCSSNTVMCKAEGSDDTRSEEQDRSYHHSAEGGSSSTQTKDSDFMTWHPHGSQDDSSSTQAKDSGSTRCHPHGREDDSSSTQAKDSGSTRCHPHGREDDSSSTQAKDSGSTRCHPHGREDDSSSTQAKDSGSTRCHPHGREDDSSSTQAKDSGSTRCHPHGREDDSSSTQAKDSGSTRCHPHGSQDDSSSTQTKETSSRNKRRRHTAPRKVSPTGGRIDDNTVAFATGNSKEERKKQWAKELFDKEMLQNTTETFPDLFTTATHLPPQRFNKTMTEWDEGRGLHVQRESNSSDIACDRAESVVTGCLETIRKLTGEPMCVISNYPFHNYLEKKFTPLHTQRRDSEPHPQCESFPAKTSDVSHDPATDPYHGLSIPAAPQIPDVSHDPATDPYPGLPTPAAPQSVPVLPQSQNSVEIPDTSHDPATDPYPGLPTPAAPQSVPVLPQSQNRSPVKRDPRKQFPKPQSVFPSPADLGKDLKRGDFDFLILSQRHGCIVIETKAVGYAGEADLAAVRKKLDLAVKQLSKAETVLRHMFRDLMEALPVRKVLAMPNVSREDLMAAYDDGEGLEKVVCDCFSANSLEEAVAKTLCADDIVREDREVQPTGAGEATPHEALLRWWRNVTTGENSVTSGVVHRETGVVESAPKLPQNVFEQIFSRLAGLYSKVTVESTRGAAEARTVADCVHLTGLRFGRPLLRSDQVQILDSQDRFVYLTGPPGSGKTLVLGLKGVQWAKSGDNVVVIVPQGVGWGSLVSQTLYQRIREFARKAPSSTASQQSKQKSSPDTSETENFSQNRNNCTSDTASQPQNVCQTLGKQRTVKESDSSDTMTQQSQTNPLSRNSLPPETLPLEPDDDGAPNVHRATVQKAEDTEQFVRDLLARYSDRPVRVIVDEGPVKVNVHKLMKGARTRLAGASQCLQSLVEGRAGRGEPGRSGIEREVEADVATVREQLTALVDKVRHHLNTISERLLVLQPPHGRPLVTQSAEWKALVTDIASLHRDISDLLVVVEDGLLSQPEHVRLSGLPRPVTEIHDLEASGDRIGDCGEACREGGNPRENDGREGSETRSNLLFPSTPGSQSSEELEPEASKGLREHGMGAVFDTPQPTRGGTQPARDEDPSETGRGTEAVVDKHKEDVNEPSATERLTAEVLDKLEADLLDVSGKLFNVETQMDFFVIGDVFSLLEREGVSREVSVWSSGVSPFYRPDNFVPKTLTHCLRCPPSVQRVLDMVEKDMEARPNFRYTVDSLADDHYPLHTDGPEVQLLDHSSHVTKAKDILDCPHCGDMLADYLLRTLRVGGDSGLRVDDVVISGSLDINNVQGRPLLQALVDKGIQLQFAQQGLTSPPPYPGKMFIIGGCSFQGLEAKVVVFVPDVSRISKNKSNAIQFRPELPSWLRNMGCWNRCHLWYVASRCISQLVVFHV